MNQEYRLPVNGVLLLDESKHKDIISILELKAPLNFQLLILHPSGMFSSGEIDGISASESRKYSVLVYQKYGGGTSGGKSDRTRKWRKCGANQLGLWIKYWEK